jgi:pimeloyl-ACP methyl ester carboxylesterase
MYYEVHGAGMPLVLLHGGFGRALKLPAPGCHRLEYAVEMYRLIPHAQLAVFPGTDHAIQEKNHSTIAAFLNDSSG